MENVTFRTEMHVRDYELDIQSIVNNSVYQNYLEHARHEYIENDWYRFQGIRPERDQFRCHSC